MPWKKYMGRGKSITLEMVPENYEPGFRDCSYGLRPGRPAHPSGCSAQYAVNEILSVVWDFIMEKVMTENFPCHTLFECDGEPSPVTLSQKNRMTCIIRVCYNTPVRLPGSGGLKLHKMIFVPVHVIFICEVSS